MIKQVTCQEVKVVVEDAEGNKAVMSNVPPREVVWSTGDIDYDPKEGTIIRCSTLGGLVMVETLEGNSFVIPTPLAGVSEFRAVVVKREEIK